MGASVIGCKFACTREINCHMKQEFSPAFLAKLYKFPAEEICASAISAGSKESCAAERMEDMAFVLNYHNRQEGIVDYRVLNWLRNYLSQGACTKSGRDATALMAYAYSVAQSAAAIVDKLRHQSLEGRRYLQAKSPDG